MSVAQLDVDSDLIYALYLPPGPSIFLKLSSTSKICFVVVRAMIEKTMLIKHRLVNPVLPNS